MLIDNGARGITSVTCIIFRTHAAPILTKYLHAQRYRKLEKKYNLYNTNDYTAFFSNLPNKTNFLSG